MEGRTDIGGFFGLELPEYGNFPQWHPGRSVAVNSGRRALEYILRRLGGVRRVHVPLYTCGTVLEPMERLHLPVIPYRIDGHLEPEELPELEEGEFLLYTNYFGIKEKYRQLGFPLLAIRHLYEVVRKKGKYRVLELGWTLEDNESINSLLEEAGARIHKKFGLYRKSL